MKSIALITALLFTTLSYAQNNPRTLDFWDGTFAYNRLTVSEHEFQSHILTLELSGSTLGLGDQIEGLGKTWGTSDKILVSIPKSSCDVDFKEKTLSCKVAKVSGRVSWTINHRVSKTLDTIFENLTVEASGDSFRSNVRLEVTLPRDEFFTPANETIIIDFKDLTF